jgi:hypothetical protein
LSSISPIITDGLQEWAAAGELALQRAQMPPEEDSILYWIVALAGNMVWAGTIFMKPNPVTGLPSTAQKALSVIGAGFGSDTARQVKNLVQSAPEPDRAKEFFSEIIAVRADQMEVSLIDGITEWARMDFFEELRRWMKAKWWNANPKPKTAASEDWVLDQILKMNGKEKNASRYYAYENYVFPGLTITDENKRLEFKVGTMRQTLKAEMLKQSSRALTSYKNQYELWRRRVARQEDIDSRIRPAPGSIRPPPAEVRVPFEPDINFGGKYLWVTSGNQTAGQVVRKWLYNAA